MVHGTRVGSLLFSGINDFLSYTEASIFCIMLKQSFDFLRCLFGVSKCIENYIVGNFNIHWKSILVLCYVSVLLFSPASSLFLFIFLIPMPLFW